MDDFIGLLVVLLFWRTVLATLVGLSFGLLLGWIFPALGIGVAVLTTLISMVAGLTWESMAATSGSAPGVPKAEEQPISRPIAFLGIALIGMMWGGVADYLLDSRLIAFLLVVVSPFVVLPVFGAVTRKPVFINDMLFATIALVSGIAVPWAIVALLS